MGFEHKYPYSDFHELNLDWILGVIKRLESEWPEFKTTLETEWNEYKDGLTGEGGEWPTFKTQIETTVNNLIHDIVGPYNENLDYQTGMFCYYEGNVYKCTTGSTAAFPRPFSAYNWFSYAGQNTNSIVNDLFNYLTTSLNNQDTEIFRWIQNTAAQWDETTEYKAGDYCSAFVGGAFNPSSWRYYRCLQDCTNIYIFDTNYWKEVVFASDVAERIAEYKQAMQDQYDQFLADYQRQFGVVQTRGSSTTDVMSQKAVSDELEAVDNTFDDIESGQEVVGHAAVADNWTPYSEDSGAIQDTPFISQRTGTGNNSVIVTTGDKAKQLEKLGNAVVYNQYVRNSGSDVSKTENNVTFVDNRDGTYTVSTTAEGASADTYLQIAYGDAASSLISNASKTDHKFLISGCPDGGSLNTYCIRGQYVTAASDVGGGGIYVAPKASYTIGQLWIFIKAGTIITTPKVFNPKFSDLTQWFNGNDNIPADLLANPSCFSWYYNGSLAYNAGSIEHGNGVKLVCTRGRNLFNGVVERGHLWDNNGIYQDVPNQTYMAATATKTRVVPNTPYAFTLPKITSEANFYIYVAEFDKNGDYLSITSFILIPHSTKYATFTVGANTQFVAFNLYKTVGAFTTDEISQFDITPYYTPEQGGEGYGEHYDYEEPDIINTGSEQFGAFDKKTPDGVIHGWTITINDMATLSWSRIADAQGNYVFFARIDGAYSSGASYGSRKCICTKYIGVNNSAGLLDDKTMTLGSGYTSGAGNIAIRDDTYQTVEDFTTAVTGMKLEVLSAEETTTQGASFRQYAGINDYGIMYFLGANDELISIPQGLKIQYPVNYKGFTDDLYMYTNGNATVLAKNESITDAALQARGYLKLTALSGYDATKTQTLKNVQGVFTWVDD